MCSEDFKSKTIGSLHYHAPVQELRPREPLFRQIWKQLLCCRSKKTRTLGPLRRPLRRPSGRDPGGRTLWKKNRRTRRER